MVRHGVMRHPHRERNSPAPTHGCTWEAEAAALAPAVDVVVEVAGGGHWTSLLERVAARGVPVVTAHKEMLIWHGLVQPDRRARLSAWRRQPAASSRGWEPWSCRDPGVRFTTLPE